MDSLLKLKDTKALDQKTSLLYYVVSIIHKNDESALTFPDDLVSVAPAVRLTLDAILTECSTYRKEFEYFDKSFTKIRQSCKVEAENSEKLASAIDAFQLFRDKVNNSCRTGFKKAHTS